MDNTDKNTDDMRDEDDLTEEQRKRNRQMGSGSDDAEENTEPMDRNERNNDPAHQ